MLADTCSIDAAISLMPETQLLGRRRPPIRPGRRSRSATTVTPVSPSSASSSDLHLRLGAAPTTWSAMSRDVCGGGRDLLGAGRGRCADRTCGARCATGRSVAAFPCSHDAFSAAAATPPGSGSPKFSSSSTIEHDDQPIADRGDAQRCSARQSRTAPRRADGSSRRGSSGTRGTRRPAGRRCGRRSARPAAACAGRPAPRSKPKRARRFTAGTTWPRENTTPSTKARRIGHAR